MRYKVRKKGYQLLVQIILSAEETVDTQKLSILGKNRINSLFEARQTKERVLTYTAPQGISLEDRMKKPISRYDFCFILEQIVMLVRELQSLSMPIESLVCDAKRVYVNEVTKEVRFIYLPLTEMKDWQTISSLIEKMIYTTKPVVDQDMDFVSRFVCLYKNMDGFDAEKIEAFVSSEESCVLEVLGQTNGRPIEKAAAKRDSNGKGTRILSIEEENWLSGGEKEHGSTAIEVQPVQRDQTGMETVHIFKRHMPEQSEEQAEKGWGLYRKSNGESIPVTKPLFRIGRDENLSDYCIHDNKRVGRNHAEILLREDRCYVVDRKSTNHTFLNGKEIPPQVEVEIQEGDVVALADEEFTVSVS